MLYHLYSVCNARRMDFLSFSSIMLHYCFDCFYIFGYRQTWHINRNTCNKSMCFTTCSTSIYFMICPKLFPASSYLNLSSVKPKHHLLPPMQPLLFLERFLTPFACLKALIKTRFQPLSAMHLCLTHNVWLVIKSSQSLELCGRCDWTRHERPLNVIYNEHIHNVKNICMNINIKNFNICIHIV